MSDWIEWGGGECPVPRGTRVDVQHRDGDVFYDYPAGESGPAENWEYNRCGGDIIHYRLHKSETETRIANLERELEALKRARVEESNKRWEPSKGIYWINRAGEIHKQNEPNRDFAYFGTERSTHKLAQEARDKMWIHNRALAYVHEHAPDWDGSDPWSVFSLDGGDYFAGKSDPTAIGEVTGPQYVMKKLADDLNSGRVTL